MVHEPAAVNSSRSALILLLSTGSWLMARLRGVARATRGCVGAVARHASSPCTAREQLIVTPDISLPGDWIETCCRLPRVVMSSSAVNVCPSARA